MSRRGTNIYKRKDGRWEGRIVQEGMEGARKYSSVYGKNYNEVKAKLDLIKGADRPKGEPVKGSLADVMETWLKEKGPTWKKTTYSAYCQVVDKYIVPKLGSVRADKVDGRMLELFVESIRKDAGEEALSGRYLRGICSIVLRALKYVKKKYNYAIEIPENLVMPPKSGQVMLPREQDMAALERYLLEHAWDGTCLGILVAFYTGIRIGEICALTWGDVNLKDGVLYVRRNLQRVKRPGGGTRKTPRKLLGETSGEVSGGTPGKPSGEIPGEVLGETPGKLSGEMSEGTKNGADVWLQNQESSTEVLWQETESSTDILQQGTESSTEVLRQKTESSMEVLWQEAENSTEVLQQGTESSTEILRQEVESSAKVLRQRTESSVDVLQQSRKTNTEIPRQKSGRSTEILVQTPKTSTSFRAIPIPPVLVPLLNQYQGAEEEYVIKGKKKAWVEPRTLQYRFAKVLAACGIEGFNFHMLRHAFATRCIDKGFDVKSLSEILGHSSVQVTLNLYVHSSMQRKKELMDKFNICYYQDYVEGMEPTESNLQARSSG